MCTVLMVTTPPYGSEGPYNAFRLAEALLLRDEAVTVCLMGDAVHAARAGQEPRQAHASLEGMLAALAGRGVETLCCGTCLQARGASHDDLVTGVRAATIHDIAAAVAVADRVVSF